MPRNAFQRVIFALLSVIFTAHGYVFYSLYVVNGATLMAVTGESGVLAAIASQGGVYMCGRFLPIWAVVLTEFCLAFLLETTMGSPCSFRLAAKNFDPRQTHPVLFESAVICATVGLMCPTMSLIAALEDAFDIMVDMDDIIDLSSFEKGKEILAKYDVEI